MDVIVSALILSKGRDLHALTLPSPALSGEEIPRDNYPFSVVSYVWITRRETARRASHHSGVYYSGTIATDPDSSGSVAKTDWGKIPVNVDERPGKN